MVAGPDAHHVRPLSVRNKYTLTLPVLVLALNGPLAAAQPVCERGAPAEAARARLTRVMAQGRFMSYEPTSLQVVDGRTHDADPASIRADLEVLRPHFDALITYDAIHGAQAIPAIASALKFRALVVGVWDPTNPAQLDAALAAARDYPRLVIGLSLGNESILAHRSSFTQMLAAIAAVRERAPHLALSSTEPFHLYEKPEAAPLLGVMDFLLVNVHPAFQPWFRGATDATAAQFVVNVAADLAHHFCGPILVKETGVPTAPASAGYSPERQAAFYAELRRRMPGSSANAFSYFSAFDAPWRAHDAGPVAGAVTGAEEAHWGLYDDERRPKPAALALPPVD
jgi:exo-beta-1,3-glucanase (GH17 family)